MGKGYLIDTNTLIEFQTNKLPAKGSAFVAKTIDESFNISIINKIEMLGYPSVTKKTKDFISLANVFELDSNVVEKTIELRKIHKIKIPDAIIAATALTHGHHLISRNFADFKNIKGLKVIDPWSL